MGKGVFFLLSALVLFCSCSNTNLSEDEKQLLYKVVEGNTEQQLRSIEAEITNQYVSPNVVSDTLLHGFLHHVSVERADSLFSELKPPSNSSDQVIYDFYQVLLTSSNRMEWKSSFKRWFHFIQQEDNRLNLTPYITGVCAKLEVAGIPQEQLQLLNWHFQKEPLSKDGVLLELASFYIGQLHKAHHYSQCINICDRAMEQGISDGVSLANCKLFKSRSLFALSFNIDKSLEPAISGLRHVNELKGAKECEKWCEIELFIVQAHIENGNYEEAKKIVFELLNTIEVKRNSLVEFEEKQLLSLLNDQVSLKFAQLCLVNGKTDEAKKILGNRNDWNDSPQAIKEVRRSTLSVTNKLNASQRLGATNADAEKKKLKALASVLMQSGMPIESSVLDMVSELGNEPLPNNLNTNFNFNFNQNSTNTNNATPAASPTKTSDEQIDQIQDEVKSAFFHGTSSSNKVNFMTGNWIDKAYLLFQKSKDSTYLKSAFNAIEIERYSRLQEQLILKIVRDSLKGKSAAVFRKHLSERNRWLHEERLHGLGSYASDSLKSSRLALENFVTDSLGGLLYQTMERFTSKLSDDEETEFPLHFYLSDTYMYRIFPSGNQWSFDRKEIPAWFLPSLTIQSDEFMDPAVVQNKVAADSAFFKLLIKQHRFLLSGIELPEKTATLCIYPHRELHLVNWDALKETSESPLLIERYGIRFSLSSGIERFSALRNQKKGGKFSGFAVSNFPSSAELKNIYDLIEGRNGLSTIPNSQEQVVATGKQFKHSGVITSATRNDLMEAITSDETDVLMIATHGVTYKGPYGVESAIVLESSENGLGVLTDDDLVDIHCEPNMVVLSSCYSAFGEIDKEEGVLSISRSFLGTGSKSVLSSVNPLPDMQTEEIVQGFVAYLSRGLRKSEALRRSKLDYLSSQESNARRHPAFWSSLILIGSDVPLDDAYFKDENPHLGVFILIIIGLILSVLLVLFLWFSKRRKAATK